MKLFRTRDVAGPLIRRADAARDRGRWREAAALYADALRHRPADAGIRVQLGHMLKEAGDLSAAEREYLTALEALPTDADLALQLGHFYKTAGRLLEAERWYVRALELAPDWAEAAAEREAVRSPERAVVPEGMTEADYLRLAPRLAPGAIPPERARARIELLRLGRREVTLWGMRRTLRGLEAVRGYIVSPVPVLSCELLLDGVPLQHHAFAEHHPLPPEQDDGLHRKYCFNLWQDFSATPHGLMQVQLRFRLDGGGERLFTDHAVIAAPVPESDYPQSDALVALDPADPRLPEDQVRARPSMVRPARRALIPGVVRNILVARTDQLGDVVASIPAMRRLRTIFPEARIVGLLTAANADLARTLDLFDEIVVADFPDDPVERRRLMPIATQDALRRRLAPYRFDLALDLANSHVSRDVLRLAGARFTYGGGGGDWPWLDATFGIGTPDRWSGHDTAPHGARVLALVEALGALVAPAPPVIRRDAALPRALLAAFGLAEYDRYALLHTGARIAFSRWPGYLALAERLIERTDLKVVLMTDDQGLRQRLPAALGRSDRFVLIDRLPDFDRFDSLLSHAAVMVGNDSGPKHLAALRGTPVVTLFTARINWSEWGQEQGGVIISRRVPCAGCAIFHHAEECAKDFTCIRDIRVEEVFAAAEGLLNRS